MLAVSAQSGAALSLLPATWDLINVYPPGGGGAQT